VAAARPFWKGYLKLSLVSCPISLYTATSSGERVSFRQINKKTGNRLRQQLVDEETGNVVDSADKGRGYEVEKGVYLAIDDEEIDAIEIESNHTIDIDRFVPKAQVDERYVDSPYYLTPNDKAGLDAFSVIRDAMRDTSMVALGRVVLSKRERVLMLQPWGKGLLGTTLRYPYEVRADEDYFDAIPDVTIPKDMLALAEHILDSKKANFDASTFHDRYEEAIIDMINVKKAGMPVSKQKFVPKVVGGVDLMAALRQSIAETEGEDKAKIAGAKVKASPAVAVAAKGKKTAKRNPDQREMLLPITGGGSASAAVKEPAKKPSKAASSRKAS
jgi:DNA end-binding protein Ku